MHEGDIVSIECSGPPNVQIAFYKGGVTDANKLDGTTPEYMITMEMHLDPNTHVITHNGMMTFVATADTDDTFYCADRNNAENADSLEVSVSSPLKKRENYRLSKKAAPLLKKWMKKFIGKQ